MDPSEKTDLIEVRKLRAQAKELGIDMPPNITSTDQMEKYKLLVSQGRLRQRIIEEEKIREELRAKAEIKRRLADVQAEAELNRITIDIPQDPKLSDVVRLEKQLDMKVKEPKPSPETIAIEKSKKVYATFRNQEEKGVDVVTCPGGKYRFHCWHGRRHVIPEWLIGYHDRQCKVPIIKNVKNAEGNIVPTKVGEEERFLWQVHGDAPADAPYGVVVEELVPA